MHHAPVYQETLNGVASVFINRPEARNCLNREVIGLLTSTLTTLAQSRAVRCIVLSGSGDESFCAGADITELVHSSTPGGRRDFFRSVAGLIEAIHRCPAPVIAKVHGYALAGGCGLAAAADIVLASEEAVFGLPEVSLGLAPMVVMAPIHRAIGRRGLAELALTGDRITAARARELGLVTRVVPKAQLDHETQNLCQRIVKQSPEALARCKAALLEVSEMDYVPALGTLADRSALLSLDTEAQEGLSAFLEKREPAWRGSGEKK